MTDDPLLLVSRTATADHGEPGYRIELPYDLRKKSRLRTRALCGREIGIQLPRGSELRDGDVLVASGGETVLVAAAAEVLSIATSRSPLLLLRAAYHLGNRHMPLQIGEDRLCYQHDHVLDDMVRGLGLEVTVARMPFQPESGAYGRHGGGGHHHHGGDHDHHDHSHHGHAHHGHDHRDEH